MAGGGAGGGGGGGGGGAGAGAGGGAAGASAAGAPGASAGPSAQAAADGPVVKAGPVEVLDADGNSQGTFDGKGKPVPPSVRFEKQPAAKDKGKAKDEAAETGIRLESLGKGVSVADIDEKTNQVVIRRSGRVIERFADDQAVAAFAEKKKLSELDRETLTKLAEVRTADRETREQAKASLGPDARATAEMVNVLTAEAERGRVRAEVERNDAEVHAWVERQKKLRQQRSEPIEAQAIRAATAASAAKAGEKSGEEVEREATFAAPSQRKTAVPAEVESQYLRVGEKYYHSNNSKAVAFVDRGDKLETPSSAPKMAEALVKIAEARGWEEMRVKGTEGFRREVWLEASVRGIHVDGYKPTELDKAELERRNTFMRDQNSIEVRSEAFQKLSPAEGVRKDPTLAGAYATEAAAKRFAEKMPPENRAAFVQSVRDAVTHKLEQGEPVSVKLKVPEGKLIEHGAANYNFDKDEKPSYYVKLAEANGRERIYWGVGLEKAMNDARPQPGDTIQLRVTESKGVVVEGNVRDADGKVVGRQTVDSHRNEWEAKVTSRAKGKAQDRQVEEERQR